jgi:hypothetical protein
LFQEAKKISKSHLKPSVLAIQYAVCVLVCWSVHYLEVDDDDWWIDGRSEWHVLCTRMLMVLVNDTYYVTYWVCMLSIMEYTEIIKIEKENAVIEAYSHTLSERNIHHSFC